MTMNRSGPNIDTYSGILREIPIFGNESLEDTAKRILHLERYKYTHKYKSYVECLHNNFHKQYCIINQTIYKIVEYSITEDELFVAKHLPRGDIRFKVRYSDHVMSFDEAIEKAINNL